MNKHRTKIALAVAFAAFVFLFFYFDVDRFFTIEFMRSERATLVAYYDAHPILTFVVFVVAFIAYIQTGLLGTWLIMLGAGAVFGTWLGALAVGLAYGIGGTIQFWIARYLFRDWVERNWGERLAKLNAEIERDGNWVLLSLRLVSIVPYASINVMMALTPIRTLPFFLITLIADTIVGVVYTNAGTHIMEVESLKDLVDTSLLASFAVLGSFPLLVKAILNFARTRAAKKRGTNEP